LSCGITLALRFQPAGWHQSPGFLAFVFQDHPSFAGRWSPVPVAQQPVEIFMEGSGFMLKQHTALDNTMPGTSKSSHLSQRRLGQRKEEKHVEHTATCACAWCSCVLKAIVSAGLHITNGAASLLRWPHTVRKKYL